MTRYVVDVMPKREILDPQGKAVLGALPRLGFEGVTDVRQGKRFEIDLDGEPDAARLDEVRRMAETLLANPVIENFSVTVAASPAPEPGPAPVVDPGHASVVEPGPASVVEPGPASVVEPGGAAGDSVVEPGPASVVEPGAEGTRVETSSGDEQ